MSSDLIKDTEDGAVYILLGRPRELRLGHKALCRFSSLSKCSLNDIDEQIMHYDVMSCLLYCMLSIEAEEHGETLSRAQCDELLDKVPLFTLVQLCGQAVKLAFDMEAANDEQSAAAQTPREAAGVGEKV